MSAATRRPGLRGSPAGLRAVALIEAAKGAVILLAGFGILALVHKDAQAIAEALVGHLHFNPANRYPRIFIELAGHLTDTRLWLLAGLAAAYSSLRFIEAYGLWRGRRWAEWFAVGSGAIYVPVELYELFAGISALKLLTFTLNLAVVAYLGYWLARSTEPGHRAS